MNELDLIQESEASKEAKKLGLVHHGGPYYKDPKTDKVVAKSVEGGAQLKMIGSSEAPDSGGADDDEQSSSSGFEVDGVEVSPDGLPVEIDSLVDAGKIDITTTWSGGQDVQVIWFDDWADGKGDLKVGFVAADGKAYSYLTGEELTAGHIERMKNQESIDYMQKLVDKKKEMGLPNTGAIMTALQDEKGVWNTTETLKKLNKQQAEKPFTMSMGKPIEDDPAKKKKYSPTKAKVKAAKMGLIKQPEPLKYKDKEVQIYRMKIGDEGKDTPVGFVASDGVLYSFVTGKKLTKATLDKIKAMGHKQYISKVSGKHYLKMIDKVDKEIGVGTAPTQQAPTKEPEPTPATTPTATPKKKKKSNYATKKAKEAGLTKTSIKLGNGPDAKEIEAYSMMIDGQTANVGFVGSDGKLYSLLTGNKLTMATVNKIKKMGFSKYMSSLKPDQWQKYIDDVEKEVGIAEIPDDPPQIEPEKVLPSFAPKTDLHPKGAVEFDHDGLPYGFQKFIKDSPDLKAETHKANLPGPNKDQEVTKISYYGFISKVSGKKEPQGIYIGFLGPDGVPLSYETGEPITQAYLDSLKGTPWEDFSKKVFVAHGGAIDHTAHMHKTHGFWDSDTAKIDPQMGNWPDTLFLDEKDTKPCPDCGCQISEHDVHEYCYSDFLCNSKKEHRSCFTEHPNASKNDKADNKVTAQDAEPAKKAPDLEAKVEKASTVDGLEKESDVETVKYWDYQSGTDKEAKLHFYNNQYGQPVAVVGGDGKLYSISSGGQKKYTKATHKKWGNKPTIYLPTYKKEHIAKHIAKTWPEFAMTGKMTAPDPEDVKPKTMKASQLEGLETHESEVVPIQTYSYGQGYITTQYKVTYYKNTAGKIVAVKGGDGKLYSVASGGKKKYTAATHKKFKDKSYGAGMWNWDSTTGSAVSSTIQHLAQQWPDQFDPQGKGAPTKAQAKAAEKEKQAKEDEKLVDTSIQITKDNEPAATKTSEAGAKYTKNPKFYKYYTKAMQMGLTPKWSNTFKNIAFTNKLGKAVAIINPDTNELMSTVTGKAYTLATHKKFKDEIADKDKQQQITDAYSGGKQTLSDIDADMITPVIATKDTTDNTEEIEITVPSQLMVGGTIYPAKIRVWAAKKLTSDPKKTLSDPTFRSMDYAFRLDSVYDPSYRKAIYKALKHVQDNPDQFTEEEKEYINEAFNDCLHQFIFTGDAIDYHTSELQAVAPGLTQSMKTKIQKETIETPFKSFMSSLPTSIKNQVQKYRLNWQGSGQYMSSIKGERNKYFNKHLKGAKFPSRFSLGNGLTFNSHMYRGMSMSTPTATKFLNAILKGGKDSAFTLPPSGFSMSPQIANSFAGSGVSMHLRLESQDDDDEMYGFQISHDKYMSEKEVIRTGTMKQKIKRVRKYTFKTQSGAPLQRVIYKVDMIDLHEHETDPDLISEKSLAEWMAKRARELVFESEASDEAKKRGLTHKHGPYYADAQGNIVAKSVDGGTKLADVKPGEVGGRQSDEKEQQQQKSVEDRAKEGDVAAQLKVQADKKEKKASSLTKDKDKQKKISDAYIGGKSTLSDIDADIIAPAITTKDTIDNIEEIDITIPPELMKDTTIDPDQIRAWSMEKLASDPKKALSDPLFRSMNSAFRFEFVYYEKYRRKVYTALKHVQDNPDQFTEEEKEYINEAFNDCLCQYLFGPPGDHKFPELKAIAPGLTSAMRSRIQRETIETPFKSFMSSLPTSIENQVNMYRLIWQGSGQYMSSIKGERNKYFNEHLKGAKFPSRFAIGNGLTFNSHMYRGMRMSTSTATKFLSTILKGGKDSAFTLPPSGFTMSPHIASLFVGKEVSMYLRLESQDDDDEMYGFQISHDKYKGEREVIRTGTMKQKIKRVRKYTFKTQSGENLQRVIYKVDMIDLHEHEADPDLISEETLAEWMAQRARELFVESEASDEAKKRGLKHKHGPYYADAQGNIVAKAVDGGAKLADVKPGEVDGEQGDEEEQQPPQQQKKSVEDRAKEGDVAAQLKVQADKKEKKAKKEKKGPSMTKEEKKKKALKVAQRTLKDVTKFIDTVQGDPLEGGLLKPQDSLEIKETLSYLDVARQLEFEYIDELDEDDVNDNTNRGAVLRSMFGYDISLSPFLPRMVNEELTNADAVKKAQGIVGNEKVLDFMIASRSTFMNSIPSESSRINSRIIIHNQLQVVRNVIGMLPKDHQYLGVLTEWQEDLEQTQQIRSNAFFGYVTTPLRRKTFSAFSRTGRFGEDPKDSVDLRKGVEWDRGRPVWTPEKWSKMRSLSVAIHLWQEYGGHGLNSEEEGLGGVNDWISENVNSETSRFPAKTDDGKPVALSRGMRFYDATKAKAFMQSLIKQGDEIELPNSGFSYDPTVPHRFSDLKPWYNDTVSVTIKVHPRAGQEEFVGLSLMDLVQDAYNDEAEVILPSTNRYKFKGYEAVKTPPQGVTYVVHLEDATEM